MFELTVSTSVDKQKYTLQLFKKLEAEIKKDGGITAIQNFGGRSSVAMAVPMRKKEYYKSKVLEHVTNMIIDDYKYNFYKDNIVLNDNNVVFECFLKAISIFDSEADKEFIKNQIELSGEILVDSFYFFKLAPLRTRWKRTADIINQNQILQSKNSMLEVLRYLITMSENFAMETHIVVSKNQIHLKTLKANKSFKRSFDGLSNFLTEIVKLNPARINLTNSDETDSDDEIKEMLIKIFNDKIYLSN